MSKSIALNILATLAVIAAFDVAEPLLAPIVFAIVTAMILAPFMSRAVKSGIPAPIAAMSGLILACAIGAMFLLFLEPSVSEAIRRAPVLWNEFQSSFESVRQFLRGVEAVTEEVASALESKGDTGSIAMQAADAAPPAKPSAMPDVSTALAWAPSASGQVLVFLGTLFFFLLSREELYRLVARATPGLSRYRFRRAELLMSRYFVAVAIINACFGVLVTGVLWAIGMPSPAFWGAIAFLVNFVPYLGPAIFAFALFIAGLIQFDGAFTMVPAAVYIALNMIEGQFVTPTVVGKRMSINPFVVFVTIAFWIWLWGPVGGIIAMPVFILALSLTGARARRAA
ncbi:AI-2E family transporter [Falsihalocynthiibacter arcticus]|uniref:Permease n=1 Tax=Falsihalocynthiibacter arcticus TaxID=1579316 RepID=A0A126V112_9RHOB|nr:AI-2E family transporter [Falsihalocynthiibacter arcticus]AML52028.1 hypothetical protein RC74_12770 [Falsihalocynthiibacter arcticus]